MSDVVDGDLADLTIDPETAGMFTRPDYYEVLARLRRHAPVHRYAERSWAVASYAEVREVSRDPGRFRSGGGVLMNDPARDGAELAGSILHMDPPEHGPWRKIASRWFTPRAVSGLEAQVRATTAGLLDDLEPGATIDAVEQLTAPLPVLVIAELLGIGDADRADFRRWSDACIESGDDGPEEAAANMVAVGELLEFLNAHTLARRAQPRDDLLSALVQAQVPGDDGDRPLFDHEVVMYCMALLVAGNETTRHLLSGSIEVLADHPDQRANLAADRSARPGAVEECLRWVTPIQVFGRTATADTELGGQAIAEGDWVVMLYASANRDEAAFGPTAGSFDVGRPANPPHMAFGFGEHLCLGASLARLEGRVFLDELLTRFPDYAVAGEPELTVSSLVRGHRSLPVSLA